MKSLSKKNNPLSNFENYFFVFFPTGLSTLTERFVGFEGFICESICNALDIVAGRPRFGISSSSKICAVKGTSTYV